MSIRAVAVKSAVLSMLVLLTVVSSAMADTVTTADVGTNLNGWLSGLGKDVLIPVTGLFGVAALFRRDIGQALVVAVIAIIVGIFVYDAPGASKIIHDVATTLTK